MAERFSLEVVNIGRNDDYEPDWATNLFAAIAYNHRLFEGTNVDYRYAFVEWNPPPDQPLLAPAIAERFSFARGIVVEPAVHAAVCRTADLQIMLNFACNAALRTTSADYTLLTGGDDFFGTGVAERMSRDGLLPGCLYRAERVNVRRDLSFPTIDSGVLEDAGNVVSIDSCSVPPYDTPPFSNACGDFLLLDAGSMAGIRGFDESITFARLHLDSRFCATAMQVVDDCRLLGRIFHVIHTSSHTARTHVAGRIYSWDAGLPYLNPEGWGLGTFAWEPVAERVMRVRMPVAGAPLSVPDVLKPADRARAAEVASKLASIRGALQPETPGARARSVPEAIDLRRIGTAPGTRLSAEGEGVRIEIGAARWDTALVIPLNARCELSPDAWYWLRLVFQLERGAIGIGFTDGASEFGGERLFQDGTATDEAFVPVAPDTRQIAVRNISPDDVRPVLILHEIELVAQPKASAAATT